ncbi:hypothetical protein HOY80DRAFT_1096216 [Tuber brumale]|nr:hypothetical protein HOY80DRAFT_1096216 [Tuber brumale]
MNINAHIAHPICDEHRSTAYKRQIGSAIKRPKRLTPIQKSAGNNTFDEDSILKFSIKICRVLRVPVEDFQDSQELTWYILCCTGTQLWKSTGYSKNDWVWVDSGDVNIYGVLRGLYMTHLVLVLKVYDIITDSVDQLVLVDRLYVENSGKISDITGLVTVTLETHIWFQSLQELGIAFGI